MTGKIVFIKAVKQLTDEHRAQVINYLKVTGKQLGLLVHFRHYPKIERERLVNQPLSRVFRNFSISRGKEINELRN